MSSNSTVSDLFGDAVAPTHKTCTKCGREKPVDHFPSRKHGRFHRSAWCKHCHRDHNRDVHAKGYRAAWNRLKRLGLTPEAYQLMVTAQNNLCAICGKPENRIHHRTKKLADLCVDHDHETGLIRGLLCRDCNVGIGNLGDDPARLRAAVAYLAAHGKH